MNKPDSLRTHLLSAVPELKHSPDRLLVFIDNGKIHCTAAKSLSFEYGYELQIILTDFPGHPDSIMLPLLGWLRQHQPEVLTNLERTIAFEVDVLDHSKVDMSLRLPLTERVIVTRQPDGTHSVIHAPDRPYTEYEASGESIQLYANGELLAVWEPAAAPDGMAMATPHPSRPAP